MPSLGGPFWAVACPDRWRGLCGWTDRRPGPFLVLAQLAGAVAGDGILVDDTRTRGHNAVATVLLLLLAAVPAAAVRPGMPGGGQFPFPLPLVPAYAAESSQGFQIDSSGEMTVEAKNKEFGELLEFVFKQLAGVDKVPAASIAGDAAILKKKVSGRCKGHSRAELIDQLEAIGGCVIKVDRAGTRAVVTAPRTA